MLRKTPKQIAEVHPEHPRAKGKQIQSSREDPAASAPPCAPHSGDIPGLSRDNQGSQRQPGFTPWGLWHGWANPHGHSPGKVAARGDISFQSVKPTLIRHLIPSASSKTLLFLPISPYPRHWMVQAVLGEIPGANRAWKRLFCRWLLPELSMCSRWDELSGHCTVSKPSRYFLLLGHSLSPEPVLGSQHPPGSSAHLTSV